MAVDIIEPSIAQKTVASFQSENTTSIHNIDKPYVINQLYQKNGMKWRTLINLLRVMDDEKPIDTNEITAYEEGKLIRTIGIEGTPSGGSSKGAECTFYLSRDSVNEDGDTFLRENDSIYQQLDTGEIKDLFVKSIDDASTSLR